VVTGREVPLEAWLAALAARTPTPSGGAAAAVSLASAAALASMVARFSEESIPDAEELAAVADSCRGEALELAAADQAAVEALYGRKAERTRGAPGRNEGPEADDDPTVDAPDPRQAAAEVPLRMVILAASLRPLLARLESLGNPRLAGDVGVAVELAASGSAAAARLVRIDARSLAPEDRASVLERLAEAEGRVASSG